MTLKLIFVPTWLEKILKASNEGLNAILEPEILGRILSTNDLDFYKSTQQSLAQILPECIVQSFDTGRNALPGEEGAPRYTGSIATVADEDGSLSRQYLYGNLPDQDDLPIRPAFKVARVGYDHVILTVDLTEAAQADAQGNLMKALLKELRGALPLETVSTLPIMQKWLESRTVNQLAC